MPQGKAVNFRSITAVLLIGALLQVGGCVAVVAGGAAAGGYYIGKDNFMSLGTFRDISRAEIRLQQVRELGLDAILERRYVTQDTYWLEFQDRGAATPVLEDVLDKNPDLQLRTLACL